MKTYDAFKTGLQVCAGVIFLVFGIQNAFAQSCPSGSLSITSATGDDIINTQNGYRHELWSQFVNNAPKGTACMTLGSTAAAFTAQWNGVEDYLARRGLGFDETQKHYEIGTFSANYNVTYNPTCTSGNSYMGVYGWTYDSTQSSPNDLVEFYIVEDWCNWNPSKDSSATKVGTILGGDYDVYKLKKNGPTIKGSDNRDFMQYFSIRNTVRTSGLMNITEHFFNWEKLGMKMGNMHEVSMLVEGYENSGSAQFNTLDVYKTNEVYASQINFAQHSYSLAVGDLTSAIAYSPTPAGATLEDITIVSSNPAVVSVGQYKGNFYLQANAAGTATLTISSLSAPRPGSNPDTATVTITTTANSPMAQMLQFQALGTTGTEKVNILLNGTPVGVQHTLSTSYQVYNDTIFGAGDITVEFVNDDGLKTGGRDVRLDYISINGVKRQTEAMAVNSAAYVNGVCGGGGFTEWLNCNGAVDFGHVDAAHKITVRARGNAGGEHIVVLINGQPINAGWTLGTSFQTYTVNVTGDGDINVRYDNDGGLRDVVIDWLQVDNQVPRQAENMQYNTGYFANGRCGGGSYSEWMQCNGVIGFGKLSDNFN